MLKKLAVDIKSKAQALVEFALVLTLLLTLIYGIMETSRLLFIYASTVTAARQATRYGSATGNVASPPGPANTPYYKDCAGIRNAAKKVGFLAPFTDANIIITYDKGPNVTNTISSWTCLPGAAFSGTDQGGIAATGDRVKVCVSTTWVPIIGGLVPLRWGGAANCSGAVANNTITKQSERTIISSVTIGVTAAPGTYPGSGGIELHTYFSPGRYDTVGQVITFRYVMTNRTSADLAGAFTISSNNVFTTCGAGVIISPGFSQTCYGYYTITQADLNAGSVENRAIASTSGASSDEVVVIVPADQYYRLKIAISPSALIATVNDVITYTYTLTNTGNQTLSSPSYTVSDNKIGAVTCPSPATLDPGGVITCTNKTHIISAADVTAQSYVNTVTLVYTPPVGLVQTTTATATVDTAPLVLIVTPTILTPPPPSLTTRIEYKYRIRNNSGAVVNGLVVTDSKFLVIATCPTSIPFGSFVECIYNYTVNQADLDAGAVTTTVGATANGPITSRTVPVSVPLGQVDGLTLTITATTNPPSAGIPTVDGTGDTFTFNYMLTNTGNTTLTSPYTINPSTIRDGGAAPLHTSLTVTCGTSDLLPGASTSANFCYSTAMNPTTNDLNGTYGFYITNLATANAKTKVGTRTVISAQQTGLVATYVGPRLALTITPDKPNAPTAGTLITYTYRLTNTGNAPIIIPSSYMIAWTITIGAPTNLAYPQSPFDCAPPLSLLPIGTSTTCTGTSSFTTTVAAGNIINDATAPATNAPPATAQAIVTTNFLCDLTHSGPIPDPSGANNLSTWYIYNKSTTNDVHINTITVYWYTVGFDFRNIKLGGTDVWTGSTRQNGFNITSTTPSNPVTTLTWPLTVPKNSTTPIVLQFSGATNGVRVQLAFVESTCSGGLDSGRAAQQEPIVSGGIANTAAITLSDTVPTITGSGGATCSKTTTSYTCSMLNGAGNITVGAYSTGTLPAQNNMVCVKPVPASGSGRGSPWATVSGSGTTETTAFKFSALPPNTTFDMLIANQGTPVGTTGYTCYSVTVP